LIDGQTLEEFESQLDEQLGRNGEPDAAGVIFRQLTDANFDLKNGSGFYL